MPREESTVEAGELGPEVSALLDELGIVRDYLDGFGQAQQAPHEALICGLQCLGYPIRGERDAAAVRLERAEQRQRQGLSPVTVAWQGSLDSLLVWTGPTAPSGRWRVRVQLADGPEMLAGGADSHPQPRGQDVAAGSLHALPCRLRLPLGYHRLELEWGGRRAETLIVAAPVRAPLGPKHSWGLFAPTYALRGSTAQGSGTLTELSELCELVRNAGGDLVATLPMLAQFLEEPFDSSPFAPASRLFWNEALLDLTLLPELAESARARALFHSQAMRQQAAKLEASPYLKPGPHIELMHALLEPLAHHFFEHQASRNPGFERFLSEQPYVESYARFRAVCDAYGASDRWPAALRNRPLKKGDGAEQRYQLHLYAQWQMSVQLAATADRARAGGVRLQLDLPLGVHSASFDMWREPDCFVAGLAVGAPADALCAEGQCWGFAPAHPEGQRAQQYRYFIAYLRNQLKYAGILRIDHVMGLHRTFCVPNGMSARDGLYLKQPKEELLAIFSLEASRADCVLLGEDLGTVPAQVRDDMALHGLKRMYVVPFELDRDANPSSLRSTPEGALATLNTHDMPTFAGLWHAHDVDECLAQGTITPAESIAAHAERRELLLSLRQALGLSPEATREETLRAAIACLARSDADMVLVTLEDLWGEREPQNVPGSFAPERNFCRRLKYRLDQIPELAEVRAILQILQQGRTPPAQP